MMSVANQVLESVSSELCEIFPAVPLKQASKMSSPRNLQLENEKNGFYGCFLLQFSFSLENSQFCIPSMAVFKALLMLNMR